MDTDAGSCEDPLALRKTRCDETHGEMWEQWCGSSGGSSSGSSSGSRTRTRKGTRAPVSMLKGLSRASQPEGAAQDAVREPLIKLGETSSVRRFENMSEMHPDVKEGQHCRQRESQHV